MEASITDNENSNDIKAEETIPAVTAATSATIFVGDLTKCCKEEDLEKIFSPYGEIVEVKIKRSRSTQKPLGYGFVTMKRIEDADMCLKFLNGVEVNGRPMRLGVGEKNSTLKITNLTNYVTVEELTTLFSSFGELLQEITLERNGGNSVAYVLFSNRENAEKAKEAMQSVLFHDRPIAIHWAGSKADTSNTTSAESSNSATPASAVPPNNNNNSNKTKIKHNTGNEFKHASETDTFEDCESPPSLGRTALSHFPSNRLIVSLYVRIDSPIHLTVTESWLHDLFIQYGPITKVIIKSCNVDEVKRLRRGYAFVHYESTKSGIDAAFRAANKLKSVCVSGTIYIYTEFSKHFQKFIDDQRLDNSPLLSPDVSSSTAVGMMYDPMGNSLYTGYSVPNNTPFFDSRAIHHGSPHTQYSPSPVISYVQQPMAYPGHSLDHHHWSPPSTYYTNDYVTYGAHPFSPDQQVQFSPAGGFRAPQPVQVVILSPESPHNSPVLVNYHQAAPIPPYPAPPGGRPPSYPPVAQRHAPVSRGAVKTQAVSKILHKLRDDTNLDSK